MTDRTEHPASETAQDAYKIMLRHYVSPALRHLGFKGSAGKYESVQDEWRVACEFQRSKFSTRGSVQFDVNLSVSHGPTNAAFQAANEEARQLGRELEMPPAGTYWSRLSLLANRPQFSWELTPSRSVEPVAQDVIDCVRDYFMPVVREEKGRPLASPTPPSERPDRPSRSQINEAAAPWHLEMLRAAGVRDVRLDDSGEKPLTDR